MSDYIEREALLKYSRAMLERAEQKIRSGKTESEFWQAVHQTQREERAEFVSLLENAPAADVAPVRHGRWIYGEDVDIQCSICGHDAYTEGDYRQVKTNYCPNCGAKMDGKGESDGRGG